MRANNGAILAISLWLWQALSAANGQGVYADARQLQAARQAVEQDSHYILQARQLQQLTAMLQPLPVLQQVLLQSQWLDVLRRRDHLSALQRGWLEQVKQHGEVVRRQSDDHPQLAIIVVDLASKANSTWRIVQINALEQQLREQWQAQSLVLADWLTRGDLAYQALLRFTRNLSAADAKQLIVQLDNPDTLSLLPTNQVLQRLLQAHYDAKLTRILLRRPADQYSHVYLQQLPAQSPALEPVYQLQQALDNPQLSSQALVLLAAHFDDDSEAQRSIEQALYTPKLQWQAISALQVLENQAFKRRLQNANKSLPVAAKAALNQQLQRGQRQ